MMTRLTLLQRSLATGARAYRFTPAFLRRPLPLARLGAALFALWFGGMFLALGLLTRRGLATPDTPVPSFLVPAYFVAAALGVAGLALVLSRRYRLGLGLMGSMLALGQLVTIAAVV